MPMKMGTLTSQNDKIFFYDINFDASPGKEADFPYKSDSSAWDLTQVEMLLMEYQQLKKENLHLRRQIEESHACQDAKTNVLREIPVKQAKKEIRKYFNDHHGSVLYPSDIADALNLSYLLVDDLIRELEDEGEIKRAR
jgi:DNA-binding MarR family transcriptional regulator